jgi:hypothetical protein
MTTSSRQGRRPRARCATGAQPPSADRRPPARSVPTRCTGRSLRSRPAWRPGGRRRHKLEAGKRIVPIRDCDRLTGLDQIECFPALQQLQVAGSDKSASICRSDRRRRRSVALLLSCDAQVDPGAGRKFHVGQDRELDAGRICTCGRRMSTSPIGGTLTTGGAR